MKNLNNLLILALLMIGLFISGCYEQVSPVLYRGSDPHKKDIYNLKKLGIKTIISARANSQRKKAEFCKQLGINFINFPTGVFLCPKKDEIDRFISVVCDPKNQPVYLSCETNIDRTTLYVAVYRIVAENWTYDQAYREMKDHHLKQWWPVFHHYKKILKQYSEDKNAKLMQPN